MPEYTDLHDVTDEVLICRALWSHAWESNPSPKHIDGPLARLSWRIMCLRCIRCHRERYDYLARDGTRIAPPYYKDPNGYPRMRRTPSEAMRLELVRRSLLVERYNARRRNGGGT